MPNKKQSKKSRRRALNSKTLVSKRLVKKRRPLHKKLLLHPITVFGLLCFGIFLIGFTLHAFALSYTVTAIVPAPALTQPAVIASPKGGSTITTIPIPILGTCPNNSYVTLTRNGLFSGEGMCTSGAFSITTDLFPGLNQLQIQDYNITDQAGPTSGIVDVTYRPNGLLKISTKAYPLPVLDAAFRYQVFFVGQTFRWTIDVNGGQPPYTANVNWGDGNSSSYNVGHASSFVIDHVYSLPGDLIITISVTDARSGTSQLQLTANIKTKASLNGAIASSSSTGIGNPITAIQKWLWLVWPLYGTVVLMAISFWLGEHQENINLDRRRPASRHG